MTLFKETVLQIVREIPKGGTMSYGEIALQAGHPGAARAVGTIMKDNYDESVPCHRVLAANGGIGQYNRGGPVAKRALLIKEGVLVV